MPVFRTRMLLHRHLKIHLVLFSEQIAVRTLKDNKKCDTGTDIPIYTKHMGSRGTAPLILNFNTRWR